MHFAHKHISNKKVAHVSKGDLAAKTTGCTAGILLNLQKLLTLFARPLFIYLCGWWWMNDAKGLHFLEHVYNVKDLGSKASADWKGFDDRCTYLGQSFFFFYSLNYESMYNVKGTRERMRRTRVLEVVATCCMMYLNWNYEFYSEEHISSILRLENIVKIFF